MPDFVAKTVEGKSIKITMTDHGPDGRRRCYRSSFQLPDGNVLWSEYKPTKGVAYYKHRLDADYNALRKAGIDTSTIEDIFD